ncbi:hypothetical protein P152DRAFT_514786 [Eremomyces bilateralis CBS 781.70]|uniref:Uncharacterized protein n=1 Tax=Eremomyces bilateralis CBS 781.70 TaxID=1392243 RepID=A0A6G1G137_9PEZI|nr:uncharacterized protein P152DRAFT_514786 [Eremomyces bilateralis CBS 781.70]KAF1811640.1 hypothetical protein P152DRAFT_514786 [Eremomyces bilateralis CBS 781.70]
MKSISLVSLAFWSALGSCAAYTGRTEPEPVSHRFNRRQAVSPSSGNDTAPDNDYVMGALPGGQGKSTIDKLLAQHADGADIATLLNPPHAGKVPDPPNAAPRRQPLTPRIEFWHPNSKTVKLRYGPYNVPNMTETGNFGGHGGMLYNYPDLNIDKPCDDCRIVGVNADLEYADGSSANVTNGMWLHHYVHFVVGEGRTDATCGGEEVSLPHKIIGETPRNAERFFSSGNEKTLAAFYGASRIAGYRLREEDQMAVIVDFMNENMEDKVVYLTVTYDYVEGDPEGYADVRPIWFDIVKCGTSELPSPRDSDSFEITSPPWTPDFDAEIIGFGGHLHDGGTSVIVSVDGRSIGVSNASYTEYTVAVPDHDPNRGETGHGHGSNQTTHLSGMSPIIGTDLIERELAKGQKWEIKATYDYGLYEPERGMDGALENIMGIAIMFVIPDT